MLHVMLGHLPCGLLALANQAHCKPCCKPEPTLMQLATPMSLLLLQLQQQVILVSRGACMSVLVATQGM